MSIGRVLLRRIGMKILEIVAVAAVSALLNAKWALASSLPDYVLDDLAPLIDASTNSAIDPGVSNCLGPIRPMPMKSPVFWLSSLGRPRTLSAVRPLLLQTQPKSSG